MKKIIMLQIYFCVLKSYSQNQLELTVRWNTAINSYQVFGKSNFSINGFNIGPTQITIVVPSGAPDNSFQITSTSIGFGDTSILTSPIAAPNSDFHGITSMGNKIDLIQNQEILLFSFRFSDNNCREGCRLFNNELDPDSNALGMNGLDFKNSIYGITIEKFEDIYSSNYGNLGTICNECKYDIVVPFIINRIKK